MFDIWQLFAWVWILLFWMNIFEESLKILAGSKMKTWLEKSTNTAVKSISTWALVTGVLQSSSLVSLLVLGFIGAWIMPLPNAIGTIVGANIWTTLDALYISFLGFGEYSIAAFAFPIISLGGLLLVLSKGNRSKQWWKLLVWFWLLFIGIDFMKESVELLQSQFDLSAYADMSLLGFWVLWVILTMIIQSSSAVSVITFAALWSGLIWFPASVAIVMWSNLGTTATPLIASFWWKKEKRQLAFAHVFFNIFACCLGALFFWQFIWLTWSLVEIDSNPIFANAVLNFIFNLTAALLIAPFLKKLAKLVGKMKMV